MRDTAQTTGFFKALIQRAVAVTQLDASLSPVLAFGGERLDIWKDQVEARRA